MAGNKDRVGDAIEDDPVNAEVVVEEGNCYGKNDKICDQQQQHHQIPVKPAHVNAQNFIITAT